MEVVRNRAWLRLALVALGHGSAHARGRRRGGSTPCLVLALACIWLLLFPVISATDDLHEAAAIAEGRADSARELRSDVQSAGGASGSAVPALAAPLWLPPVVMHSGWISDQIVIRFGRILSPSVSDRAPPTRAL